MIGNCLVLSVFLASLLPTPQSAETQDRTLCRPDKETAKQRFDNFTEQASTATLVDYCDDRYHLIYYFNLTSWEQSLEFGAYNEYLCKRTVTIGELDVISLTRERKINLTHYQDMNTTIVWNCTDGKTYCSGLTCRRYDTSLQTYISAVVLGAMGVMVACGMCGAGSSAVKYYTQKPRTD